MSKLFARNLKTYRTLAGMTQTDLAQLSGLTRAVINNYERGQSEPSFESLCRISDALGISVTELLIERAEYPAMMRRELVTDDEAFLLQVYRKADPTFQSAAVDILRAHPKEDA